MSLKGFYYVYFVLWRLCRASKDKSFGEFRVHLLLMLIEVNFVFGLLLLMRERLGDISFPVYMGMFLPVLAIHFYIFENDRKRAEYERVFKKYPKDKRRKADILAILVCLGAFLLPLIAGWITE